MILSDFKKPNIYDYKNKYTFIIKLYMVFQKVVKKIKD